MKLGTKIQDHAAIGNGRSAVLVTHDGAVDWLCWPRFDSPFLFGALLDAHAAGCWTIRPSQPSQVRQQYLDGTNVLETRFENEAGVVVLIDFMPAGSEEQKRGMLFPEHELIRRLRCESGECNVAIRFAPCDDYGRRSMRFRDAGALGLRAQQAATLVTLRSDVKFRSVNSDWVAQVALKAGEHADFSLSYSTEGPAIVPPLGELVDQKLAMTCDWWRAWAERANYEGPYRDEVIRSALTLKLMLFAPSGAMIAAPTTSLPEIVGGDRNWDYRFCWLRDAAFTSRAWFGLGYRDEGNAFVSWLLHATRLTRPELKVVYDVYGNRVPKEIELTNLDGYMDSRPVRIGNAARNQVQLDVYGEVIEAVVHSLEANKVPDRETQRMLRQFGTYVCEHWREPDNGIWETREGRKHFIHSRLMCWVAIDRLLQMHRRGQLARVPADEFRRVRNDIRCEIEECGWNARLQSYTQTLDGDVLDATALLPAFYGFERADSFRMQNTLKHVLKHLSPAAGLLFRNERDSREGQGAFAMCGFWIAEFLARGAGTLDQAQDAFEQSLRYANDVGLFAEEIDPETGDALGNFPQLFTHIGLINAAISLEDRTKQEQKSQRRAQGVDVGEHV
jgi:GH15 family glucan-1,4-alpha-glucosidase